MGVLTEGPFQWGEFAVGFFIILSGISYLCFSRETAYGNYIWTRIKLLFSTYAAINVAIFIGSFVHPSALGRPFTLLEFALSLAGVSQYLGFRYASSVMWFFPFIVQVYLLLPLLKHLAGRWNELLLLLGAFVCSAFLVFIVLTLQPESTLNIARNWSPLFRLPEVMIGVIIGNALVSGGSLLKAIPALATYGVVSGILKVIGTHENRAIAYIMSLPWCGLVVTALIALLSFGIVQSQRFTSRIPWRLLGAASYPFFLGHGMAMRFLYGKYNNGCLPWLLYFVACWAASLLWILFWNFVKLPRRAEQIA